MTFVQDEIRPVSPPPPPGVGVWRAMAWNWWVVVLAVVLLGGAGAAYGLLRTPIYTATARLAVGRIDITSPGALSGYAVATQSLATGYSRTASALAVARQVSARTGIPAKEVQKHVSATPVPESPVFKVEGTSPDSAQAIVLANETSRALIHYAAELNRHNPDSARLYAQYKAAIVARRLARTPAERKAASLRVEALARAYTASVQGQVATQLIQVISPATEAVSDRRSRFIIFVFIGLVAGLLVGAGLAYARETRWNAGLGR